jgi:hypothetical protein
MGAIQGSTGMLVCACANPDMSDAGATMLAAHQAANALHGWYSNKMQESISTHSRSLRGSRISIKISIQLIAMTVSVVQPVLLEPYNACPYHVYYGTPHDAPVAVTAAHVTALCAQQPASVLLSTL